MRCTALLLLLCRLYVSAAQESLSCPVCLRVVKAARDLADRYKVEVARGDDRQKPPSLLPTKVSEAFEQYCALDSIAADDKQFCYNVDNVRGDLYRILDLGASEVRVCVKVKRMNPDFCKVVGRQRNIEGAREKGVVLNDRLKRGVIFE